MTSRDRAPGLSRRRELCRDAAIAVALGAVAWGAPALAMRRARSAVVHFGPNDWDYVQGFRSEWERLGPTRFHWTTVSARVSLPLHVRGAGHVLRMRVRRHFIEPAHVRLMTEGRSVGAPFDLQADTRLPYRVVELPLPPLEGPGPFVLMIDAPSENPRPLGIALDWLEVERTSASAAFLPLVSMRMALLAAVLTAFLAARLSGAAWGLALAHGLTVVVAGGLGTAWDVVAAERILREGTPAFCAVAAMAVGLTCWRRPREALSLDSPVARGVVVVIVLMATGVRLVLLLHPQFYYPDVKVHALFAWELARRGLPTFLRDFTLNQYRYSLGLQMENGHWYAFPYPPAFYMLCWPLIRLLRYRPEVAVSVLGAAVNSLEAFLVFAIARRLGFSTGTGLASALAHPVLPLFLARLTLAYFPALVGHAMDVVVVLFLLSRLTDLDRPRVVLTLAGLLALSLLTYTQALLNFAILLPLFLLLQLALDRTPRARARQRGLVVAGLLGVFLSVGVFYGRYIPVFLDMHRGVPMPEEQVLLEKMERSAPREEESKPEEPDDPFTGPGLDLLRGVRKAAWRVYVFYGVFAPVVVAGLLLACRSRGGAQTRFIAAWALTYLILNLASGGLPGPNLVRYNKDLEIVAPLFCTALGVVGVWLWERGRALALAYAASFWVFGVLRASRYLTQTFVLER